MLRPHAREAGRHPLGQVDAIGADAFGQSDVCADQQHQAPGGGYRPQTPALLDSVRRAESAKYDRRADGKTLGDGLRGGNARRIGEEQQPGQRRPAHDPWRKGQGRTRQGSQFVLTVQGTPPMSQALVEIRARIAAAEARAGRPAGSVTLVAVSKTQPWDHIAPVLDAGQKVFGENRVQEAMERWGDRREGLELRLIGPLQTNKAREAVGFFDVIETLDREKLARVLADEVQRAGRAPRLYVQVNVGEEPQKAGVAPDEADAFIAACRATYGLAIEGLMCIPPFDQDPAPHFAKLCAIAARNDLNSLSMGMSDDFEIAIAQGATSVRVGSALFGGRNYG